MNTLSALSRTCARQKPMLKSSPSSKLTHHPLRTISTNQPKRQAQPIELTSSRASPPSLNTPPTQESGSTLTPRILSASPSTKSTSISSSSPQPPQQQPQIATVSRTNTMNHTIQLTQPHQTFSRTLQKHFTRPRRLLAHDPHPVGYLRTGDVVEFSAFTESENKAREEKRSNLEENLVEKGVVRRFTKRGREVGLDAGGGVKRSSVRFVVRRVITPFGVGVEERLG